MNRATHATVATIGVPFALGGMNHGLFEMLQGDVPSAAATRIRAPLSWWRRVLRPRLRPRLAPRWKALLVGTTGLGLLNLWLATTGWLPGGPDDDTVLAIMLVLLLLWYAGFLLTFVAGFAHDIEAKPESC